MLPMGTIMAACMVVGVVAGALASRPRRPGYGPVGGSGSGDGTDGEPGGRLDGQPGGRPEGRLGGGSSGEPGSAPAASVSRDGWPWRLAGGLVALAGLWNVLWYAPRHLGEFWGGAALGSGLLMLLVAAYVLVPGRLPPALLRARPLALVALGGFALLYGVTIYRL